MKLSSFKEDTKKALEGVVRNFDVEGKCYIRVARANSPKFEAELRRQMEPFKNFRRSKVNDDVVEKCTKTAMAKAILLEMVGFEDDLGDITGEKGAVIPDTFENRLAVLMHPNYRDFVDMVSVISHEVDAFKADAEEEEVGNSAKPSGGSGDGAAKKRSSEKSNA